MDKLDKAKDNGVDWIAVVIYGLGSVFYSGLITIVFRGVFHPGKATCIIFFVAVAIFFYLFMVNTEDEDDKITYPSDGCGLD